MKYARTADGTVIEAASSGERALCPACHGEVLAKCGDLIVNHWAHRARDCDPWSEPETEWHREWKSYAPIHRQEVVIGAHRADIVAANGVVVEIQHSNISGEEIRERERFYKRLLWIFDARAGADRMVIKRGRLECKSCGGSAVAAKWVGSPGLSPRWAPRRRYPSDHYYQVDSDGLWRDIAAKPCDECEESGFMYGSDSVLCTACDGDGWVRPGVCADCRRGIARGGSSDVYVKWKHARKDWMQSAFGCAECSVPDCIGVGKKMMLDTGNELLRVVRVMHEKGPTRFLARAVSRAQVAAWIAGGPVSMRSGR